MLTKKQAALFWRCLAAAAERQAVPDREAYRKRILREELGVEHMRDVGRTEDFDKLMLRLAQDAEDWHGLAYYSVAGERRLADLVADCATQVLELFDIESSPDTYPTFPEALGYISGILRQSGMSPVRLEVNDYWLDLDPADLARLLQILDTHRRRLIKRLWIGPEVPLRYVRGRGWSRVAGGRLEYSDRPPSLLAFRVNILARPEARHA